MNLFKGGSPHASNAEHWMLKPATQHKRRRERRQKGAEMLEFTLAFLPLIIMVFVLLDVAWAVFAKATLQYAVRTGVRRGITLTGTQATAAGGCLTDIVKTTVQNSSLGLLSGSSGLAKIKVNYFQPPAASSSSAATDVSNKSYGNTPNNIMQVSVQNFSLAALLPRIYGWRTAVDSSATTINAASADLIEPSRDVPCIGTAP
jgi:Flp pilus assembly protein TadG